MNTKGMLNNAALVQEVQRQITVRSLYKGAAQAATYARRLSIKAEQTAPLAKLLVNSDTAIGTVFSREVAWQRRVWLLVYGILMLLTIFTSVVIIMEYITQEAVYALTITDPPSLTLPAITICNKNPIRKRPLCAKRQTLLSKWNLSVDARQGLDDLCKPNWSHLTPHTYRQMVPMLVQPNVIHEFGHDIHGMLRECAIKGKLCKPEWFLEAIDLQAGRCWCIFCNETHDDAMEITNVKTYNHSFFRHGLTMLLDTQPDDHIDEASDGDGFLLKIHQPGIPAYPFIGGINIPINQTTYIAVRPATIEREPGIKPDLCISDWPKSMNYVNREESYSQQTCINACQQNIIAEVCDCVISDLYHLTYTMPPCPGAIDGPAITMKQRECSSTLDKVFLNRKLMSNYSWQQCGIACFTIMQINPTSKCSKLCRPLCDEMTFEHRTSRSRWHHTLKDRYVKPGQVQAAHAGDLVKVVVYLETITLETLTSDRKMTYVDALVEVGGTFGTYIGLTALIVFEVVEVSIRYLFKLRQNQRDTATAEALADEKQHRAFFERQRETDGQAMQIFENDLDPTLTVVQHRTRWSALPAPAGATLR